MTIDTSQLKYKFSKAKHGAAQRLVGHSHLFIGAFCTAIVGTSVTESILHADLDEQTTQQTAVVQQQLQRQFSELSFGQSSADNQEQQRDYLESILIAEDISEQQAYDMLRAFEKSRDTDIKDVMGYDIGNIGDLRESRAEIGAENMRELAEYNKNKSMDEKIVGGISDFVLFPLMILLCMFGSLGGLYKMAQKKPKNPLYKH